MTDSEQQAILSVMLLAAFADGMKDRHERSRIRELVETLPGARSSLPRHAARSGSDQCHAVERLR